MNSIRVKRTYLHLLSPHALRSAHLPAGARIEHAHPCPISFFRYLYTEVGRDYRWRDRLSWTNEQCAAHLDNPDVSIWVLYLSDAPSGYFELNRQHDGSFEIAYLGLMPDHIGRGLGKALLSEAANCAWSLGASRVWLHTCTLDGPAAMPNYLARGFQIFHELEYDIAG